MEIEFNPKLLTPPLCFQTKQYMESDKNVYKGKRPYLGLKKISLAPWHTESLLE